MSGFPGPGVELTTILVVREIGVARDFWRDVVGAEVVREYGGTSCVLRLAGAWLLLVTGGGPTADKPDITFAVPADPRLVDHAFTMRGRRLRGRLRGAAGTGRSLPHAATGIPLGGAGLLPGPGWSSPGDLTGPLRIAGVLSSAD